MIYNDIQWYLYVFITSIIYPLHDVSARLIIEDCQPVTATNLLVYQTYTAILGVHWWGKVITPIVTLQFQEVRTQPDNAQQSSHPCLQLAHNFWKMCFHHSSEACQFGIDSGIGEVRAWAIEAQERQPRRCFEDSAASWTFRAVVG